MLLCKLQNGGMKVIVPRLLVDQVLNYAQGAKSKGHKGVWKTLADLRRRFW